MKILGRVVDTRDMEPLETPAVVTVGCHRREGESLRCCVRRTCLIASASTWAIAGGDLDNRCWLLAALSAQAGRAAVGAGASRAAAGKSPPADAITRLVPAEDLRKYTRVTGQALLLFGEDAPQAQAVAIEEAAGAEEAAYSIRTLQFGRAS